MTWARLLSWIWPVRVASAEGRHGRLELVWEYGRLVVNSPHANQSHGALHRVWQRVLGDADIPSLRVRNVLLLGLGTGSVVHILRRELGITAPITAVEHDPVMLEWGRRHFGLDRVPDLRVIEDDACAVLPTMSDRFDLVLVDLFDDLDLAAGTETPGNLRSVVDRVAPGGLLCWNTIARNAEQRSRVLQVENFLGEHLGPVRTLTLEGTNRVLLVHTRTA